MIGSAEAGSRRAKRSQGPGGFFCLGTEPARRQSLGRRSRRGSTFSIHGVALAPLYRGATDHGATGSARSQYLTQT
jgi:hypothetical protein